MRKKMVLTQEKEWYSPLCLDMIDFRQAFALAKASLLLI